MRKPVVFIFSALLALCVGCSSANHALLGHSVMRGASDAAGTLPAATPTPADAAGTLPGDAAGTLPGDAAGTLPGDAAGTLPADAAGTLPATIRNVCAPAPTGQAMCLAQQNLDIVPIPNAQADPLTIKGYQPRDIQAMYHLPSGAGQTVAIVDAFDNPNVEADLAVYRSTFGLPPCTTLNGCFQKLNQQGQSGTYPMASTAWGAEIALDVEMVSAACPACKIVLIEANSASIDDLGAAVDLAVSQGIHFISNSYAASEWPQEANEDIHFNHPGYAITVAAGDGGMGATYPASSIYVTAVGGSVVTGSNGNYAETQGWSGAGRGCSGYIARPSWQRHMGCGLMRAMNDVAALADPGSGVAVYDSFVDSGQLGGWEVFGGTSVGAPVIASAYALANDYGSYNNASRLYARRTMLHTIGNWWYQYTTGLGSPNGVAAF